MTYGGVTVAQFPPGRRNTWDYGMRLRKGKITMTYVALLMRCLSRSYHHEHMQMKLCRCSIENSYAHRYAMKRDPTLTHAGLKLICPTLTECPASRPQSAVISASAIQSHDTSQGISLLVGALSVAFPVPTP